MPGRPARLASAFDRDVLPAEMRGGEPRVSAPIVRSQHVPVFSFRYQHYWITVDTRSTIARQGRSHAPKLCRALHVCVHNLRHECSLLYCLQRAELISHEGLRHLVSVRCLRVSLGIIRSQPAVRRRSSSVLLVVVRCKHRRVLYEVMTACSSQSYQIC